MGPPSEQSDDDLLSSDGEVEQAGALDRGKAVQVDIRLTLG